jgi:hypothetical protein
MKVVELVRKTNLIIWDEALMMHRRTFEVVDQTLRDLMELDDTQATKISLVGKLWSLLGIFDRSCLLFPREDEKTLLMLRLHLWQHVTILRLHINM